MPELQPLQQWMQDAVLAGGADPLSAARHVRPSPSLTPEQRVGIYAGGYRGRLIECLRESYPVLRRLAGETAFDLFARSYVEEARSHEPSLWGFGAGFADHLAGNAPAPVPSPAAIPAELARLERAREEVQRAVGTERLPALHLAPGDCLVPGMTLRVPDSVRLLCLGFDFEALVASVDAAQAPAPVAPGPWRVAVARSHYRVRLHPLDAGRFAFLEALAAAPAVDAAAADAEGLDAGALLARLALWLPEAAQHGLVAAA